MADAKKSRSAIRIKSSERKKSGNKGDKGTRSNSQEVIGVCYNQEEEARESLAYKVLSEEQTVALKELTPQELEAKLAEILNIDDFHISLPEACVLDYYVAGFWFTKEQNFNTQQSSAFFTVLSILLENIKEKHMTLAENLKAFKGLLAGIGVEHCSLSGGLECFDVNQAKIITDYLTDGLFQHYNLYSFLFTKEPEEEVITTELKIQIPPMADIPFPPPLDEGMTEEVWREYIMTPPHSPLPDANDEEMEKDQSTALTEAPEGDPVKDILSTIDPDVIKTVIKKTANNVFGNFKVGDLSVKEFSACVYNWPLEGWRNGDFLTCIQVPSVLPDCIFNSTQTKPSIYLLSPGGEKTLSKILYTLSQIHPDIQFCPLLPPIAALHLHFMDEDEGYCCISAMLDSNRSFFDQSQRAVAVMAKTFQDCLKMFMKKSYKHLKSFISLSQSIQVTKGMVLLPHWISWMFAYLDFWTLVYIVDNFLIQGPKVLVRVGLILFSQFSKWLVANQAKPGDFIEVLFSQFMSELTLRGYKLLEAAFKIRGLSKKKLTTLRTKNLLLLKDGILEVPFSLGAVKVPTLYAIQGTDILSDEQWELLSSWLPEKTQINHPFCLFSTQNDGCSVQTLYNKCEKETETVLLVKTSKGELLGAFCSSPWDERCEGPKNLSYFGTGETFVFSLSPKPEKFSWNGAERNDYFMAGDNKCLLIGGG
ncbi:hypothetical protein QZH41_009067 [Actinostola sp. cb2023]|nr:hypothetical protein QZH41_009067 [Actinostola sp. cb2023]